MKNRIKILITLIAIMLCSVMAAFIAACADDGDGGVGGGLGGSRKQTHDMSKVVFSNYVVAYDGQPHSIEATNLPAGVEATYDGNAQTQVGTYTVTAHFAVDEEHYNPVPDRTATLTIIENKDCGVASANGFEVADSGDFDFMRLRTDVSNKTEHIDLSHKITVAQGCTWKLFRDFEGFEELPLKSVNLKVGDNTVYAIVYKNDDFLRYEVTVRRLDMKIYLFDNEGVTHASGEIEEKSKVEKPADPVKDGYTFTGWSRDGETDLLEFPYTVTEDMIFVAHYELKAYSITYNLDGGTNAEGNPATYNRETPDIDLLPAYRKDYTFAGWYSDAQFNTQATTIQEGTTGDLEFYAMWLYGTEGLSYGLMPDGTYKVMGRYKGTETEVVIPSTWERKPVTAIGDLVFTGSDVTSVDIPEGIVSIGTNAFSYSKLKSLHIPASATTFKEYPFTYCAELESVTFAENSKLTALGSFEFADCKKLKSIIIPDSVKTIGFRAFGGCDSLESVTIGSGVTTIEREAFYECRMLQTAFFKVTTGWKIGDRNRTVFDDTNADVNAYNLKIVFVGYLWTRS